MLYAQVTLVFLVLYISLDPAWATHYGGALVHSPAGAEDYPQAFVISTLNPSDKHGHQHRGYGHGHRDYNAEPKYVIRNPYGVPLNHGGSEPVPFHGGDVGPLGMVPVGYYGHGSEHGYGR
ncbi:uncharacterized protein LOC135399123 [Ornithodoros turicata]|uniref:uncharacterized protein LOC135399123 n=1 Tax=Ornithodoros turicata TaxID=34597 RepID=UPI00313909AE